MNQEMCTIAIAVGDPAGIGPEVTAKALADPEIRALARWVVIDEPRPKNIVPGRVSAECGGAALEYVRRATELCLLGEADAMVTGPLNKEAVALTVPEFTGHTEFIAELCGRKDSRMLLVNPRLAVAHVTTHVPLRQACEIDSERVARTIRLGAEALAWMGKAPGRIAVCGLNPHAGEHGLFGQEEMRIIEPAIQQARAERIDCAGPFPADTLFLKAWQGAYDLVVALYHDQGHIPMKLLDFENTVNVTLGLPIIRTSVDHGTAYDIAGKGLADATNMKAALRLAVKMAQHRKSGGNDGT